MRLIRKIAATVTGLLVAGLLTPGSSGPAAPARAPLPSPAPQHAATTANAALPLAFEENQGQVDPSIRFLAHGAGFSLALSPDTLAFARSPPTRRGSDRTVSSPAATLRFVFPGANANPAITAEEPLPGTANYFIGSDPTLWRTNVPTSAKVRYRDLYPGIDLTVYGRDGGQWEYDVIVAPGADPAAFALALSGADRMTLDDASGDLVLTTAAGVMRQHAPTLYQEVAGVRQPVAGGYDPRPDGTMGFRVGSYDPALPLVIDPSLAYSTFIGGSSFDSGNGIAVDTSGNAYIVGTTTGGYPTTPSAFQTTYPGSGFDLFVTKLNPTGTALVYSTYIGGAGANDEGNAIVVDTAGNAYVTGDGGTGFPVTAGAAQTTAGGNSDAFVAKLNPTGTALVYATFLGGSGNDEGYGIAVDTSGNAYITGDTTSTNFATPGAFQTTYGGGVSFGIGDAFVAKLNAAGSAFIYKTYLGGSNDDQGKAIAVDTGGNAYITGYTSSSPFPTTASAFQTAYGGGSTETFVTKLNSAGSALVYSTYLGGNSGIEEGRGIAVDASGNAYLTGRAGPAFPITAGAFQTTYAGNLDAFVTKLNATGTALVYSTLLGGDHSEEGFGIAVDASGNAYVAGSTSSGGFGTSIFFPTTNGAYQATYGGGFHDAFLTKLNPTGTALVYSTYLGGGNDDVAGGIAVDSAGNAYITGKTSSSDFPTTPGVYQTTNAGGSDDAFVTKFILAVSHPTVTGVSPTGGGATGAQNVTITGTTFVAGAAVTFGNNAATNVTVVSATTITAATPAGAAGVVSVTVTNPDGGTFTLPNAYTYTVINALPNGQPAGPSQSGANPIPPRQQTGPNAGIQPNPLPQRRP